MIDLIRREDATSAICEGCDGIACCGSHDNEHMWCFVKSTLMNKRIVKSVDAAEVKHGYWIDTDEYVSGEYDTLYYDKCSLCGDLSLDVGDYCPNCGARMDSAE